MADTLVAIAASAGLELALSPDTITREMNRQKSIIDLIFAQHWALERLIRCGVRTDLHQGSDHLSIATELNIDTITAPTHSRRVWKKMDNAIFQKIFQVALPSISLLDQLISQEAIDTYTERILEAVLTAIGKSTL